jgi:hypothetical protein
MNDEARRWINLEGPPPLFIQELFDAARDVEPLTPEEREKMDRSFFKALAEQRQQAAEKKRAARRRKLVLGGAAAAALAAGAAAAAVAVVPIRYTPVVDVEISQAMHAPPPEGTARADAGAPAGTAKPRPPRR